MKERMFPRRYTIKSKQFGKTGKAKPELRELENHIPEEKRFCKEGAASESTMDLSFKAFSLQSFKKALLNK